MGQTTEKRDLLSLLLSEGAGAVVSRQSIIGVSEEDKVGIIS